ncbi:MAG TPA: hypothetical protein ENN41_09160 [Sediminispirochaeta sp.]|nr:hypothetical protein [Sediminispirochaeta sp.]
MSILLLTSCLSTIEGISGAIDQTRARGNQALLDAVGVGAIEDGIVASMVYAQVFFAGGYGHGYDEFSEGEGARWELTSRDESGAERMEIERALLKRTPDGNSWWLLRSKVEGEEEFVSEALLDQDYGMLKFRYRDPETGSIREWEAAESKETKDAKTDKKEKKDKADKQPEAEAGEEDFFWDDYSEYVKGKRSISVPAGKFNAEYVLIEDVYVDKDDEEYRVSYEWWLAPQVPGRLVKYVWTNESEEISLTGELLDYGKKYKGSQLDSF